MSNLSIIKKNDNLYRINEKTSVMNVDCYLVCGEERAVVIDALYSSEDLYYTVRSLTNLPLDLILTHGHQDHCGKGANAFIEHGCSIYLAAEDNYLFDAIHKGTYKEGQLKPLEEGTTFDLGGITLKTYKVGGHTKGSAVFLDEANKILFAGDAFGSANLWIWLPDSIGLTTYLSNLERVKPVFTAVNDLKIYPGHTNEILAYKIEHKDWVDINYFNDIYGITKDLVDGKDIGSAVTFTYASGYELKVNLATRGQVNEYCYDPKKVNQ